MTQNILLVTSGTIHPPFLARRVLRHVLKQMEGYAFQHVSSLEALPRLSLANHAALVLYFHHKTISEAALSALDSFISQGGGLLAIHSATASFKPTRHYFEILGGRFTGHGAVETFEVQPVSGENGPFAGIPAFQIYDELYLHELQPGIQAHFQALHQGEWVPVVWTYRYGKGKVCYVCPGHTTASLQNPQVQEILRRGLAWVSG